MHPDLEKLVHLQLAENDVRKIEDQIQEVPVRKAEADAALRAETDRLSRAREELANSQRGRRQDEAALQDLEGRRSKYKGQLMEVKTNKEYTAVLHEIEGVERDIRVVEDRILEQMEAGEDLTARVAQEEQAHRQAEEAHRRECSQLDGKGRELEAERARLVTQRDAVASSLPPDLLDLFRRVARLRGVAVAEARDGMCQHCHMVLRPQMYVDLKRNDAIQQCPSCSRILHYIPTQTVVPNP